MKRGDKKEVKSVKPIGISAKIKLNQPNQSGYQPKSKYISQNQNISAKPIGISAKIKIYQPNQSRYQPKSK